MLRATLMLFVAVSALACTSAAQEGQERDRPRHPMPPEDQRPPQEDQGRREQQLRADLEKLERALADAKDDEQRRRIEEQIAHTRRALERIREAGPRPPQPPMTVEEINEVMEFAKEFHPEAFKRMQEGPPDQQMRIAQELRPHMLELRRLKEQHPDEYQRRVDMMKLEGESFELAEKIRQTTDEAERDKLKAQLTETLSKQFDLREQRRAKEIEELERRIAELKKNLEKRKESKAKIVEKRAQEMLGSEYEW